MPHLGTLSLLEAAWTGIGVATLIVQSMLTIFAHDALVATISIPDSSPAERLLAHSIYEDEALLLLVAGAIVAVGVAAGLTPPAAAGMVTLASLTATAAFFVIDATLLIRGTRRYLTRRRLLAG